MGRDTSGAAPSDLVGLLMAFAGGNSSGIGSFSGQQPDVLDTALAIRALAQVPSVDPALMANVVSWLKSVQSGDGGWGYTAGQPADPYMTATVVEALGFVKSSYDVAASLDAGLSWLSSHMQSDGSLVASPVATACAIRAYARAGRPLPSWPPRRWITW